MQNNVIPLPLPPRRLTNTDMLVCCDGEQAALSGNGLNPHQPGTTKHDCWEWGYKFGARRVIAMWWGILECHAETPSSEAEEDESLEWYRRGQAIGVALGAEKLDKILGRL